MQVLQMIWLCRCRFDRPCQEYHPSPCPLCVITISSLIISVYLNQQVTPPPNPQGKKKGTALNQDISRLLAYYPKLMSCPFKKSHRPTSRAILELCARIYCATSRGLSVWALLMNAAPGSFPSSPARWFQTPVWVCGVKNCVSKGRGIGRIFYRETANK